MEPKKNLIRTIGISFGVIAVLFVAIWYMKSNIDKKFLSVKQLQGEIAEKQISLSDLAKLQSDAEKAKQYIPQLDHLFTTKDQLLAFSSDAGLVIKQAGFSGTPQFKEDTAPQTGTLQKTNFSLLLEGQKNFGELAKLFALIEDSKYFVRFTTLDITREGSVLRVSSDGYVLSF